ncbi:MAG: thiamine diphosphokinase [Bacteroidales bacterium]|nr:thiamine diphosphokinase [Bacteroidales bacterium]
MARQVQYSAVIIGGGEFPRTPEPLALVAEADYIVCCDGVALENYLSASKSLFGFKRNPDAVIGDFDSISPKLRMQYAGLMVEMSGQDDNDQTKALNYTLRNFPAVQKIFFIAATGKREDHTVGNMSLLMEYATGIEAVRTGRVALEMVSDWSVIRAVTDSCTIEAGSNRPVSIFSPDPTVKIKSEGLQWKTDDVVFDNWWKATLNRTTSDCITLQFSHPAPVLIVLPRT